VVGLLADRFSVESVLWAIAFVPLAAIPLILAIPARSGTGAGGAGGR
jgi:hypothetical protein